jgi:hypothetical protein
MRNLRSALGTILALALAAPVASRAQPADVQVQEATGQAAVLGGDKPSAREKAIQDALRQAVQMAVGTQVTSTTEVQDFQTKMDQVLTHSQGYVRKYSITKEGMDGDVVQVTIRAEVGMGELNKDLMAMGLLMARKNMPRTMVLVAEQNIGMAAPAAVWMKSGADGALVSADLRIAENVMLDSLSKAGFGQLIDPEIASTKAASIGGITTKIDQQQAKKLGSLTGAEVILIGQVIATSRGSMGDLGPEWRSCTATINVRAVTTDNGDVLATADATQNAAQLDDLTCGKEAIKKASKAVTSDIAGKITQRWSKDVSGGNQVHLTVKGIDSMKQASDFRSALTNFIRGVKGVNQRSFSDGKQELDITLVGSTEQFAEELEAKGAAKTLGKFSVKVKGLTANTVDVELGK